jgi:O-Antigen ligase
MATLLSEAPLPAVPLPIEESDKGMSTVIGGDRAKERLVRSARFRKRAGFVIPMSVVGLASLAALIDPLISWLLVLIVVIFTAFLVAPVKPALLIVLGLATAVDNPRSIPASGNWESPWIFIGDALFKNLEPLPLSMLDLVAGACLLRGLFHFRRESRARLQRERVFGQLAAICVGGLLFALAHGLLRGGDLKQSVYQMRAMLYIPSFGIAIATVGDIRFLRQLKSVLLFSAIAKGLTGIYPYLFVEAKSAKTPMDYVTIHADSVLYSMAFAAIIAAWIADVEKRLRRFHFVAMLMTLVGLYMNQRRIAFVSMIFALGLMYLDAPPRKKRQINKFISKYLPMFVIYMAIAFSGVSRNAVFRPALSLRSVVIQDDRSSSTRDIENYNLYATFRPNPLIGTGFGHEYNEVQAADYIGDYFPQYRYLPHNSFLGLWAFGGIVTAMAFYSIFPTSLYLGLRAAKRHDSPERWTFAMIGAAGIAAVLVQAFGDVGLHDSSVGIFGGIAVGMLGALYCANETTDRARHQPKDDRTAVRLTT